MAKKLRYVICNVPAEKQRKMDELLFQLIHEGIIKQADVHIREEE